LRWQDEQRHAPELVLNQLNVVLQNRWRSHQFALRATPPEALAAPIDIRGNFQHKAFSKKSSDFSSWTGDLYADLHRTDLPLLKSYLDYPAMLSQGHGSVRAWLHLDAGRIAELTADLKLNDVLGKLAQDLPEMDMSEISGRIVASEKKDFGKKYLPSLFGKAGHTLELNQFVMKSRDGVVLPPTTVKESFTPATRTQAEKVELYAQFLDLQALANFAGHLPLPADQRQMLADFAPRGQLKEFSANWQGSYPNVSGYQLKGQFINLSMQPQPAQLARNKTASTPAKAAVPAIPGFSNLSGSIDANDQGGRFLLDSKDLQLSLSSYFVDPVMPFNRLQMQASWHFEADDKLVFQIARMDAQQDSMHLSLTGKHILSMRHGDQSQPGQVDLTGHINGFDLKQLDRYIPTLTPTDLRHWLLNGILDGRADDVSVRIRGDLAHFPFSASDAHGRNKGEFLVKGKLSGAKLDFTAGELMEGGKAPLWPVIDNIKGNFIFDRARMEINADTAKTLGADLRKVKATIPDLLSDKPLLTIDGNASAPLQTMLAYVAASPVDGWLGHFLSESRASAAANLNLKLQLPLQHLVDAKVQGILQLLNNDVVLQPGIPLVTGLNGKLEFNEHGVNLNTLKGSALGGVLVVSGGSLKDNSIRVRLDGTASGVGLADYLPESARAGIAANLNGSARYTASIWVKKQLPEIVIESGLQGMALNLPSPLRKTAMEIMPLRVELQPKNGEANLLQDELRIRLGNVQAKYLRQKSLEKNASWQLVRGGIGMNVAAPEPERGVVAHIESAALNVDEWRPLMSLASSAAASNKPAGSSAGLDFSPYLAADRVAINTGQLQIFGKQLDHVVLGLTQQNGAWQANIHANQVSGSLSWSESASRQGMGTISARLSQLTIPKSAASDVSDLLEGKTTGAQIPGLDIVAENFELFNKKLGRLELQASNQTGAQGREWHLSKVLLKNPDAELNASGKWSGRADGNTRLDYTLSIANTGQLLARLGFENVLQGGRGKLEGNINWNGMPFALDIPSMSGTIQMDLAAGQFLKVDPGAAKLLGVLSMQSLPRRLTLDFRDVFSEGFAFDAITGTAQIEQGIAKTDNLKMRGVNATVLMGGTADIVKETQQLHVAVIPVVNAGAASVVYGLAVNPVIGLGTFLAQLFLREPLAKAFTFEYTVSGPWSEPVVKKLERQEPSQVQNASRETSIKKGE
jgi:uncharacterized protein (TIGR02099 family)